MFNLSQLMFGLTFGSRPLTMRWVHIRNRTSSSSSQQRNVKRVPAIGSIDEQQRLLYKYKWMIGIYICFRRDL
jgi:hypothetical protein